jgi:hypothetical protein
MGGLALRQQILLQRCAMLLYGAVAAFNVWHIAVTCSESGCNPGSTSRSCACCA